MLHRVNKLQFETVCATEAQAFGVRNKFAQIYQGQIEEVIDKVCSKYVSEEECIQIDKIEVDLENFNLQVFEESFTNIFLEKFEREFSKKINSIPSLEKTSSKQDSYFKLLIYFLQNGTLPWWTGEEDININNVLAEVVEQNRTQLYTFLEQQKFNETIWQRISLQFNTEVHQFILSIFPVLALSENKLVEWISLFAEEKVSVRNEDIINSPASARIQKFVLMHAPLFFRLAKPNILELHFITRFAEEFILVVNAGVSVEQAVERIITFEKKSSQIDHAGTVVMPENKKSESQETPVEVEEIRTEKYTVHTAGVVLLAPYFKQLFSHLKLFEHGEWKNRDSHYKAIHLVRYLATGEEMCPEHSLVIEKLLCGIEINAPIPREVELSEEEKTEAAELLKSVIANWSKLKNTSVAGLRETFLKREGILTKKENGWLLRVERKTQDVLLESIPWGFSTLAFSWTDYTIFTEW